MVSIASWALRMFFPKLIVTPRLTRKRKKSPYRSNLEALWGPAALSPSCLSSSASKIDELDFFWLRWQKRETPKGVARKPPPAFEKKLHCSRGYKVYAGKDSLSPPVSNFKSPFLLGAARERGIAIVEEEFCGRRRRRADVTWHTKVRMGKMSFFSRVAVVAFLEWRFSTSKKEKMLLRKPRANCITSARRH